MEIALCAQGMDGKSSVYRKAGFLPFLLINSNHGLDCSFIPKSAIASMEWIFYLISCSVSVELEPLGQ